jgi:hypothetical protein
VEKMVQLRWTEPGFFDNAEDEVALLHGIARYHASVYTLDMFSNALMGFIVF